MARVWVRIWVIGVVGGRLRRFSLFVRRRAALWGATHKSPGQRGEKLPDKKNVCGTGSLLIR